MVIARCVECPNIINAKIIVYFFQNVLINRDTI